MGLLNRVNSIVGAVKLLSHRETGSVLVQGCDFSGRRITLLAELGDISGYDSWMGTKTMKSIRELDLSIETPPGFSVLRELKNFSELYKDYPQFFRESTVHPLLH